MMQSLIIPMYLSMYIDSFLIFLLCTMWSPVVVQLFAVTLTEATVFSTGYGPRALTGYR